MVGMTEDGLRVRRFFIFSILFSAFVAIGLLIAIFATWPYGLRLLGEGFPSYQWPAKGHFAVVEGDEVTSALKRDVEAAGDWTRSLFEESKGKVLLAMDDSIIRLELAAKGVDPNARFNSFSMVKSLVGVLVLKAHADGLIDDLSDPLGHYLPDFSTHEVRARSVSAFLQMRSGLDFEVDRKAILDGENPKLKRSVNYNPFSQMTRLHMLGLESVADTFVMAEERSGEAALRYQNVNTAILAHLLEALYAEPIENILSQLIWKPAGAQNAFWRRYDLGRSVSAYCCLYATAEDWLRVGRFLLVNGGEQGAFLPSHLWARLFGRQMPHEQRFRNAYGDHIYHNLLDRQGEGLSGDFSYFMGNGGQMLYMMPEKGLVVVRFGEGHPLLHSTLYAIWRDIED